MEIDGVDVLLLCAVQVEWECLKSLLVDATPDARHSDPAIRGRIEVDGRSLSSALVEVGMGLTISAMATLKAVETYQPALVVFVGIAGGIKDVRIGDVVVVDKVYPYEIGKVADGQFQARPDTRTIPSKLLSIARKLRANFSPSEYRLFIGALASGDKVVADINSIELERIRALGGDSLAVEMEGAAVLSAIDRADVTADHFVVRGISDLISNKSETDAEGGQERAIEHARETTVRLIEAWNAVAQAGVPVEDLTSDLLAAGLPLPSPTECYILIAVPASAHAEAVVASGLPISLVIDLNPRSDEGGLLARTRSDLETRRAVHLGSPENPPPFGTSSSAWVSVQGLDHPITDLHKWTRNVRRTWRTCLATFASAIGGRRITILVTDDNDGTWDGWCGALVDDLLTEFGERAYVGMLGTGRSVESDFRLALRPAELATALSAIIPLDRASTARMLPGAGGLVEISAVDASWIEEDIAIYWTAEPGGTGAEAGTLDFLRGGEITLAALGANADVSRAQAASIQKQLLGMLGGRRTLRLNLFHAPGAGGSTLARRIGFNIRTQFPVVFLRRFREAETIRRIESLSRQTKHAVLVVAEAPDVRDDQIAAFMNELHSVSLPAVVLAVSRAYSPPSAASSSPYIAEVLSDTEAQDFVDKYSAKNFAALKTLQTIAGYNDHRRNAFYFGLAAFEENFQGIEPFVRGRLAGVEGAQREVMLVCSIAYYFGQSPVPEYALARIVGLPPSRSGGFARILAPELRGLLWRSEEGQWRTTHPLVAEEILRQLGGGHNLWTQALSGWGRVFADFCLDGDDDDAMHQLIASVFTERDDDAAQPGVNRESFARLIEKIPSRDGASELLKYLADRQPDNPHVWAHTARYYAFRMAHFQTAETYAKRASALSPDSSTLHHILGMVYRSRVYDGLGRNVSLDELSPWVDDASREFEISRDLAASTKDHGFVSEIQMRVKIVEHAIRESSLSSYLRNAPHQLVVSSVEKAEDLMSTLRYRGDPRKPSGFEQTERAKLKRMYGDFSKSLQLLDSLLQKGTVPLAIVRRQLVWTYLARVDRNWRALPAKDVNRVVALLDENLTVDGYTSSDALAWWRAVRLKNPAVSHERVKEVLAYWRESNPCLDAEYCSFVAYSLDVLAGLPTSVANAAKHARRSAELARSEGTRTRSVDWYGDGMGMASLVHHSELGQWDPALDFWADTSRLRIVEARIKKIRGPQAGTAEVSGVDAFFVPQRAGVVRGRHENERIRGYLAFTHDGLRIWEPTLVE
ncbi:nucleoside phosphorylase [Williamsia muralis]|uniref:Nucleoside phosphorylase n=1 Tax=Williamsia marianensis TaxID=85044 RepID=A0A495K1N7_WILMA|nr:5'-methylthioadenosine/S-adenosylhomocysteine nucleosidase [Williamsia muralis]RKR95177.1 nucleoside phosphorylase [Williamsia muralis]